MPIYGTIDAINCQKLRLFIAFRGYFSPLFLPIFKFRSYIQLWVTF